MIIVHTYRYASSVDASHFDTSAKLNRGIEEMFLELSQKMIKRADEKSRKEGNNSPNSFIGTRSGRGNTVTIVDDSELEVLFDVNKTNGFDVLP